ncbi:2OG-Fe(II) oxygenase [Thalassotalea euphylliae]|uniref:2OG-Fe(II) oxygenase n=1 Tax=Thalassotalea euphylliae TaxID=1655234 RepID=UPI0015F2621E|nr:2OG-Fe(II) oxygenase family protein [Thalassotalea euphylliae]
MTSLTINPTLTETELQALQEEFSEQGIVRIFDFLSVESIEPLARCLSQDLNFTNAFFLDQQNREGSDEQIAQLNNQQRRELYQGIYKLAAQGQGFLYGRHKVEDSSPELLKAALELINGETCLSTIKRITDNHAITHADGQATRYRVGDFLTRHVDNLPGETRKYAYVLGLSPNWHPDWGGLLQMFEIDGTPTKAFMPVFNSLTLFDVNKVHSVTSIAPFSPRSRYSITGWFRT